MNKLIKPVAGMLLALSSLTFSGCEDDEVIGLDDAAKYGNIVVTLEGTRTDDVAFTKKLNFRFVDAEDNGGSSVGTDGDQYYFYAYRFLSAVSDDYSNNYAVISLSVDNSGDSPVINGFNLDLSTIVISESDHKFFYLNGGYTILAEEVTSYSYNPESGKLNVKFTSTIDADSNNTGNDLKVSGTVSITVFEYL